MAQCGPVYLYCLGCRSDLSTTPRGRRDIGVNSLATPEPRNCILMLFEDGIGCQKPEVDKQIISSSHSLWEVQQKHHSRLGIVITLILSVQNVGVHAYFSIMNAIKCRTLTTVILL